MCFNKENVKNNIFRADLMNLRLWLLPFGKSAEASASSVIGIIYLNLINLQPVMHVEGYSSELFMPQLQLSCDIISCG